MDGLLSRTSFAKRSWSAIGLLVFQTSGDRYLPTEFLGVSVKAAPFDSDHAECGSVSDLNVNVVVVVTFCLSVCNRSHMMR